MDVLKKIQGFLGIGVAAEVRERIARRNMPIMAVGSVIVALFAAMLAFTLFTGTPSTVNGFDEAAYETPETTLRFEASITGALIVLVLLFVYSFLYLRRNWKKPRLSSVAVVVFSFIIAMLWGLADSGRSAENQVLIFASLQFLVSGLLVMSPLVSLGYFAVTFGLFGSMLGMYGEIVDGVTGELAYLAFLDILVSWVVYGLYRTSVLHSMAIADKSRRDELTGAKNRHYLRDDFSAFSGQEVFIMLCDIDDFKHYNDGYNHDVGDALLRDFFFALRETFGDECTYRYGGDEFLVVSPDFGEEEFLRKTERCARELERVQVEGESASLTFSGGYVYGTAQSDDDFRAMLHEADEHLLAKKQAGKNGVQGGAASRPLSS